MKRQQVTFTTSRVVKLAAQCAMLALFYFMLAWQLADERPAYQARQIRMVGDEHTIQGLRDRISQLEDEVNLYRLHEERENLLSNTSIDPQDTKSEIQLYIQTILNLRGQNKNFIEQLRAKEEQLRHLNQTLQSRNPAHLKMVEEPMSQKKFVEITSEEEFRLRQNRVHDICKARKDKIPGTVKAVFADFKSGVLYCMVPKAGCTFWKRIFYLANGYADKTERNVFNISRSEVHFRKGGQGKPYNAERYSTSKYPTRMIVSRDPYSRLLSSYLDKIYLPDFWPHEAHWMLKGMRQRSNTLPDDSTNFLRRHFDVIANTQEFYHPLINASIKQSTRNDVNCGKFLTFEQFIREGLSRAEPHWQPIHEICEPCDMHVSHVSTMETFTADARAVLGTMGLGDVLDNMDEDKQVDIELDMIVHYNFERTHEKDGSFLTHAGCLSDRELAYRLWHNFRWRGYIDPDVEYVIPKFKEAEAVKADLLRQIWRARESGLKNSTKMQAAREEFKRQMFLSIPRNLFEDISRKYALDLQLFGYESTRDQLRTLYESRT